MSNSNSHNCVGLAVDRRLIAVFFAALACSGAVSAAEEPPPPAPVVVVLVNDDVIAEAVRDGFVRGFVVCFPVLLFGLAARHYRMMGRTNPDL